MRDGSGILLEGASGDGLRRLRSRGVLQYAPRFVMVMKIAAIRLKWNRAVYFSHVVFLCYFLLDQKVAKNQVAPNPFLEFPLLLGICFMFKNVELELEIFHVGLGRISIRPYETHAVAQSKFF